MRKMICPDCNATFRPHGGQQRCFACGNERRSIQARACSAVHGALATGKLVRQPCEVCGGKAEAHHDDYADFLAVRWLCRAHHRRHHTALASSILKPFTALDFMGVEK